MGGPAGYGELTRRPNDDESSSELRLPFHVRFFREQLFSSFYVNNNGNISFGSPLSTFTPMHFPASSLPVIAPFWADVDTSKQPGGGAVDVGSPNENTVVVTWSNVGDLSGNNDKLNKRVTRAERYGKQRVLPILLQGFDQALAALRRHAGDS